MIRWLIVALGSFFRDLFSGGLFEARSRCTEEGASNGNGSFFWLFRTQLQD